MQPSSFSPEQILEKYFGYSAFRLDQKAIIESVLAKKDTLAILPTGGGKSLCYQIPGLLLGGTTLVISPLISLMKDQVEQLQKRGIAAAYINSSLTNEEVAQFFINFTMGKYQFVYLAPERLTSAVFLKACQQISIPLIAIDEAHCVSQWGHDFRPEYLQIKKILNQLKNTPRILAVTATATQSVRQDIILQLGLNNPAFFLSSFARTNLHILCFHCQSETEKRVWLLRLWQKFANQKKLIYCSTRAQTQQLAKLAQHFGYPCGIYHAGLSSEVRARVQGEFTAGKVKMLAATNAFGMGIDIPDIKLVIHTQVPSDIEGYYQEIGRAGRDGQPAECYLFHSDHDQKIQNELFDKRFPQIQDIKVILNELVKRQADQKPVAISVLSHPNSFHILHVLESIGYVRIIHSSTNTREQKIQLLTKSHQPFQAWQKLRDRVVTRRAAVQQLLTVKKCRSQVILEYFGENSAQVCQKCDVCLPQQLALSQAELQLRQRQWRKISRSLHQKPFSKEFKGITSSNVVKYLSLIPPPLSVHEKSEHLLKVPGIGEGFVKILNHVQPEHSANLTMSSVDTTCLA